MSLQDDVMAAVGRGVPQGAIYSRLPGVARERIDLSLDVLTKSGRLKQEHGEIRPRLARLCGQLHVADLIGAARQVIDSLCGASAHGTAAERSEFHQRAVALDAWVRATELLVQQLKNDGL